MAITNRDEEILKFINVFGKSYANVLGKTFFNDDKQAKNRITSLKKMELIDYKPTMLLSPRNALILTSYGRNYLIDRGIEAKSAVKIHASTIWHNVLEQIAYYWLSTLGEVTRTTVYHHANTLNHVPDLIYIDSSGRKFYIEVELTQKSMKNYEQVIFDTQKDNPFGVIYITMDEQKAVSLAKNMPVWDRLFYIDIETFVKNVKELGKIQPNSQESLAIKYV